MEFDHRTRRASTVAAASHSAPSPGKRTLTEGAVVQHRDVAATGVDAPAGETAASPPAPLPGTISSGPRPTLQMLFGAQHAGTAPAEAPAPALDRGALGENEGHRLAVVTRDVTASARPAAAGASGFDAATRDSGVELPYRAEMERAFGQDLGGVRTHLGRGAELAALGANAATMGERVAFASDAPGRALVAHEVAHVIQSRGGGGPAEAAGSVSSPDDPAEVEASMAGRAVLSGERPRITAAPAAAIHLDRYLVTADELPIPRDAIVEYDEATPAPSGMVTVTYAGKEVEIPHAALTKLTSAPPLSEKAQALIQTTKSGMNFMIELGEDDVLASEVAAFIHLGGEDERLEALVEEFLANYVYELGYDVDDPKTENPYVEAKLPDPVRGEQELPMGVMKWELQAQHRSAVQIVVEFVPEVEAVNGPTGFVQTVLQTSGGAPLYQMGSMFEPGKLTNEFKRYAEPGGSYVDPFKNRRSETPFYTAQWSAKARDWVRECSVGMLGTRAMPAKLGDRPYRASVRLDGDYEVIFESAVVELATAKPLGSLKWGYAIKDSPDAPIEWRHAAKEDCVATPSPQWSLALDRFYEAHFAAIVSFAKDDPNLGSLQQGELLGIAKTLQASQSLKVHIGGAADALETDPDRLAEARAQVIRDFLENKGNVSSDRIVVTSYGAKWARSADDPEKNARVQVWIPGHANSLAQEPDTDAFVQTAHTDWRSKRKPRAELRRTATAVASAQPRPAPQLGAEVEITLHLGPDERFTGGTVTVEIEGGESTETDVQAGQKVVVRLKLPAQATAATISLAYDEYSGSVTWGTVATPLTGANMADFTVDAKLL
jgi:outer membrane protein OmpA-like peptidoglycan-associated protein